MQALEVKVSYARYVAKKTRDLERRPGRPASTTGSSESADGRVTWTRFEELVEAAVVAADPEAAAERERQAEGAAVRPRHRGPPRTGCVASTSAAHFAVIARLDATVAHLADALEALGVDCQRGRTPRARGAGAGQPPATQCGSSRPTSQQRSESAARAFGSYLSRGRAPRPHLPRP